MKNEADSKATSRNNPISYPIAYVDKAMETMAERLPEIDLASMHFAMMLQRAANGMISDVDYHVHRPRGSSWSECRFLFAVWVLGRPEANEIARVAGVSRAAVSGLARSLEKSGHIVVERGHDDRRRKIISLTDSGRKFFEDAYCWHNARESVWTSVLKPGELYMLTKLLERMVQAMSVSTMSDARSES